MKKIQRIGHGFRNLRNYRLRLLLHCGGVAWQDQPAAKPQKRTPPQSGVEPRIGPAAGGLTRGQVGVEDRPQRLLELVRAPHLPTGAFDRRSWAWLRVGQVGGALEQRPAGVLGPSRVVATGTSSCGAQLKSMSASTGRA